MATHQEISSLKQRIKAKAEVMANNAIGKPFAVRVGRNEVNRGIITQVETLEPIWNGRSVCARWRVHYAFGNLNFPPVVMAVLPR